MDKLLKKIDNIPAKNQHYVPDFYLSKFKNSDGLVNTLNIKYKDSNKSYSPKSLCSESYFYGLNSGKKDEIYKILEYYYTEYEVKHAPFLLEFEHKINQNLKLENSDIYNLCEFVYLTWTRGKTFRDFLNKEAVDFAKLHLESAIFGNKELKEAYKALEKGNIKIEANNKQHIEWILDENNKKDFINKFFGKKINIYIANGKYNFVTSDNFLLELTKIKDKTIRGTHFCNRYHYVTLTPNILIEFGPSVINKGKLKIIKPKRHRINDDMILYLNQLRLYNSEYLYSNNTQNLDKELLDRIEKNNIIELASFFGGEFEKLSKDINDIKKTL